MPIPLADASPGGYRVDADASCLWAGLDTDATPVKARVYPYPDNPTMYAADPVVVVRGPWVMEITVAGARGNGTAWVPLTVAAPAAIPVWLGWLLGFSPLLGVVWFAWWQWRWMRRYSYLNASAG